MTTTAVTCHTGASDTRVSTSPGTLSVSGGFVVPEAHHMPREVPTPDGIDSLITTTEAATLCGVSTATVRKWVQRNKLQPSGLDETGRNLFRVIDVAKAERATRQRARR
ncbi:MerR-like transcriptional regulator [Gordonia phage Dolores]|uniref:MerR-like helix-turn-helix DNA binding protein n=2 Tax=Beenievirus TaxID=3044673 RepID=A0A514DIG9_9CAUD|nr:MerR-like transcriptional regulator [Gordonia phage Sekhmet]YP_010654243.1 MerR-like transcriptional regulator [Gordonia phage Dolores]QDH93413.1 MerR-like helix-turn-helix DNA binding protein [Gordonia phage Sekhmet]UAJ16506.1 helix-turn-helix DNA binding domain protein [Gordonia phage Dolores]URM87970.1 MerR-like helix-turn-helix DNA binding domain protein [Gordonia phage WinkNick]